MFNGKIRRTIFEFRPINGRGCDLIKTQCDSNPRGTWTVVIGVGHQMHEVTIGRDDIAVLLQQMRESSYYRRVIHL